MDKGKVVRLVLIPIIIGLVVTLIIRQMMAQPQSAKTSAQVDMASVVTVATKEAIPARTKLNEQQLVVKQVPKAVLTGSEFTSVKDVAGQITQVVLEPGEVILKSRVVPEGKGALPFRIPAGTRAMTIRIDELSGVAGNPEPGDLVDLVLFLPEKKPDRAAATARILYEQVLVLGKGPAAPASKTGATGAASTPAPAEAPKLTSLTLALAPDAAVDVALAQEIGHITVLLRPALKEGDAGKILKSELNYK